MDIKAIEAEYNRAINTPSDINEHIKTLFDLACECDSIVEGGVRYVVSTWAFILGCACRGGKVDSYCWTLIPEIQRAIDLCKNAGVPWSFYDGDWLEREIPECDMLFIDTNHFGMQLRRELEVHAPKARKFLVFHDTTTFGTVGADGKRPGLMVPINEIIAKGDWSLKFSHPHCNGLTVLEKA